MKGKYSAESLLKKILELDAIEFLGVCKILGIEIYELSEEDSDERNEKLDVDSGQASEEPNMNKTPRDFYDIWSEICDIVAEMNRTRRRNLGRLIYSATKKEK